MYDYLQLLFNLPDYFSKFRVHAPSNLRQSIEFWPSPLAYSPWCGQMPDTKENRNGFNLHFIALESMILLIILLNSEYCLVSPASIGSFLVSLINIYFQFPNKIEAIFPLKSKTKYTQLIKFNQFIMPTIKCLILCLKIL